MIKTIISFTVCLVFFSDIAGSSEDLTKDPFASIETKEQFAQEISTLISTAWQKWQDKVRIDDVDVEGPLGLLLPGDMSRPVLKKVKILKPFRKKGKTKAYVGCITAVSGAVEEGMRSWQRGYMNRNIPFPQGSSCAYTLPLCNNVPVTVGSGQSLAESQMTEETLYLYMLYHVPVEGESVLAVLRAAAKGIYECFNKWKNTCFIVNIEASGGMAPSPISMGPGSGPVRGAKGNNGRLEGESFNGTMMFDIMMAYLEKQKKLGS